MNAVLTAVSHALEQKVPAGDAVCVALSGGMDSMVLLDAMASVAATPNIRNPVTAVHVHHGLSPNADAWADFCEAACRRLGVPLQVVRVTVAQRGRGLEDAARDARYVVFRDRPERWILQAHHADDAVETLLLRLNRGAGLKGLCGIPPQRSLGPDQWLLRPLLKLPRTTLLACAKARELAWIEDESNVDSSLDRNYLRTTVLPDIQARFPSYRENWLRASEHAAAAQRLLDELAAIDIGVGAGPLSLNSTRALTSDRLRNALRYYLHMHGAEAPDVAHMADIERRIRTCGADSRLAIRIGHHALMHARGALHVVPARMTEDPPAFARPVVPGEDMAVPELAGTIRWRKGAGIGLLAHRLESSGCVIRSRLEGERMKLAAGRPNRTLKNLFQEQGVPEWERAWLPRLAAGAELIWVPGLGISASWQAVAGETGWLPCWEPDCQQGI